MDGDLKWIAGLAVTFFLAFTGAIIGTFRNLSNKISKNTEKMHEKIDDVKENYVRRDDLNGHLEHVDTRMKELRDEQRENHKQVIALLRDR